MVKIFSLECPSENEAVNKEYFQQYSGRYGLHDFHNITFNK